MVKYTLRALCLFIISLIVLGQMAQADVTQNVTFTVKNNGVVEATSDIGSFTSDVILMAAGNNIPTEFRQGYEGSLVTRDQYVLETPIGYNMLSEPGHGGYRLPISFRIYYLIARSAGTFSRFDGSCQLVLANDAGYGVYRIITDNKPFSTTGCSSFRANSGGSTAMFFDELQFAFMEDIGGKNGLSNMKLPAGRYTFPPQLFRFRHDRPPNPTVYGNWYVNVTVVVEPSIDSVNMPTALPLDVAVETANKLTGQGSVLATVTGNLGSNLKILPASANNGQLVKGAERIPYTLSVVPLSGDNKSRLLIDGNKGGAQPEVVIETKEKRDQYQFRFDASFATTLSNLSSGRFSDNVTLIFTTNDLP